MALSIVYRSESPVAGGRTLSRRSLHALASAWRVSTAADAAGPGQVLMKPQAHAPAGESQVPEPPYWPDGPDAA